MPAIRAAIPSGEVTGPAPADGTMTLDTGGSSFDTLLAVYTGSSVTSLTPIVSNDDYTNLTSLVVFGAKGGKTYLIAVDGFNGASGAVQLNLAWKPPVLPALSSSLAAPVERLRRRGRFRKRHPQPAVPPWRINSVQGRREHFRCHPMPPSSFQTSAPWTPPNYTLVVSDELSNAVSATRFASRSMTRRPRSHPGGLCRLRQRGRRRHRRTPASAGGYHRRLREQSLCRGQP